MMRYRLLLFCAPALAPALLSAAPVQSAGLPPLVGAMEVYQADVTSGFALGGFDPVTYFLPEGPRAGRPDLEAIWSGVAWRFSSEANRSAFMSRPDAFAPRLGGYDAGAMASGKVVDANPLLFLVSGERLYLFRTDASRALFLADETLAARAEAQWSKAKGGLVRP